ncbi:MAG: hypothetical protein WC859_09980 [Elusimicrobiota bacterium]|jgi:hypothetical protein
MTDLFLDPKVLNYTKDRYQLIVYTMRWARAMKAKGSPEPLPVLIEKALKDIVEGRVTPEEIMANKAAEPAPKEDVPAVVSVADDGASAMKAATAAEEGEKKKTKKKKKKENE